MRILCASALLFVSSFQSAVFAAPHNRHPNESPTGSSSVSSIQSSASDQPTAGEEYVVIIDSDNPTPPGVNDVLDRLTLSTARSEVKYMFDNGAFRGFAATMEMHCIDELNIMSDISYVEKSTVISTVDIEVASSPWGLERISSQNSVNSNSPVLDFNYTFEEDGLGEGVDIYVMDTGVNVNHRVFGDRARMGFSFETDDSDGDGHGTHVAGTAAGAAVGIANKANIIGVKVLGADGSGSSSDAIAGMDFVIRNHRSRQSEPGFVGSIMSMSWGLDTVSNAINTAIQAAVDSGIHVSVAAGNSGQDSCDFTPSSAGGPSNSVISVGSMGITDVVSDFSNTGVCTDIYAPGEGILSAWIGSNTASNILDGTSMACPHVTGVMACIMSLDGSLALDPAALKEKLLSSALRNEITGFTISGDNRLLLNNYADDNTSNNTG